ncbi:MAG: hypothetical protein LBQ28_04675 [Prevotellaceae bacterium]|jgi:hypothetical protein|nr:hypothetical protein [Prevotellaceae bacterium]
MTVKELKKILRNVPDDAQVEYAGAWSKYGEPVWWQVTAAEHYISDVQFDEVFHYLRIYGEEYPEQILNNEN